MLAKLCRKIGNIEHAFNKMNTGRSNTPYSVLYTTNCLVVKDDVCVHRETELVLFHIFSTTPNNKNVPNYSVLRESLPNIFN